MSKNKTISLIVAVVIAAVIVLLLVNQPSSQGSQSADLKAVRSFQDAHGLAVDPTDSKKVYIASHNGLLLLENDQNLYQVGKVADDYMGFSIHPTNGQTFFTSGHTSTMTGNLGFQKSDDGGRSWEKLSNGVNGPVDFHAMAVSQANPELVYGVAQGRLQRSTDGGNTWQVVPTNLAGVISLTTHPSAPDTVYAATQRGLQVSKDRGQTWQPMSSSLPGAVAVLAINPANPAEMLTYSQTGGLAKSADAGQAWTPLSAAFAQQVVLYVAYDKQVPTTIYALTQENQLHKSSDGGASWRQIR